MGDSVLAFGFIWVVLAPVSILLAILLVGYLFKRLGLKRHWLLAIAAVTLPITLFYTLDRRHFDLLCASPPPLGIFRQANADGFVLTSGTAGSFGSRYLHQEGFRYYEALEHGRWTRFEKGPDGTLATSKIDGPTARYEVREDFEELPRTITFTTVTVLDRTTGEVLARDRRGHFSGGSMRFFLGGWGSADCLHIGSADGGAAFNAYIHLARDTLGGKP